MRPSSRNKRITRTKHSSNHRTSSYSPRSITSSISSLSNHSLHSTPRTQQYTSTVTQPSRITQPTRRISSSSSHIRKTVTSSVSYTSSPTSPLVSTRTSQTLHQHPTHPASSSPSTTSIPSRRFNVTPFLGDVRPYEYSSEFSEGAQLDKGEIDPQRRTAQPQASYQRSATRISVARYGVSYNALQPQSYWDYENYRPVHAPLDDYVVDEKLGHGKYSEVFSGYNTVSGKHVVIKVLKPVRKERIKRELLILNHLKECPFISTIVESVRDPVSRTVGLVFEYQGNTNHKLLYKTFNIQDLKRYTYQILTALEYTHSRGIMHRDVKPGNILIDHTAKIAKLSDWGLGDFYHPYTEYSNRVGSKSYKAPELLLKMVDYDYSLDMWPMGLTFAAMMFQRNPLLRSEDDITNLRKIAQLTGSDPIYDYIEKYKLTNIRENYFQAIGEYKPAALAGFVNEKNIHLVTDDGLDLLSKFLVVDHQHRISAAEALQHPYFDDIRHDPSLETLKL